MKTRIFIYMILLSFIVIFTLFSSPSFADSSEKKLKYISKLIKKTKMLVLKGWSY